MATLTDLSAGDRQLDCRGRPLAWGGSSRIIGILNTTPDSFSDGGRWTEPAAAVGHAAAMAAAGAAAIDVGGQSTRPGHEEVSAAEEIARVVPALQLLVAAVAVPLSIDTYRPEVARAALAAGAHLINSVRGLRGAPGLAEVAAEAACPVVVMHHDPAFAALTTDPVDALLSYFAAELAYAASHGLSERQVVLDPGIGFFKTARQNLQLLRRAGELRVLGQPLLVGASRKSIIGKVLGDGAEDRLEGTLAITALAVQQGVDFLRVHDVRANVRAARMAAAILSS